MSPEIDIKIVSVNEKKKKINIILTAKLLYNILMIVFSLCPTVDLSNTSGYAP